MLFHSTNYRNEHATPIPLPYLTPLFKKYIWSYTDLKCYILPQLSWFVTRALDSAQEEWVPEIPIVLAEAKRAFTEYVYLSGASTELKKDLFEIPLDDLFKKCLHQLQHVIVPSRDDDDTKMKENVDQVRCYLLDCACYEDADLAESLGLIQSYIPVPHIGCHLPSDYNAQKAIALDGGFWAGMVQLLEKALAMRRSSAAEQAQFGPGSLASVIRQLIQFAMNCVDVWILHLNTAADQESSTRATLSVGKQTIKWAWDNMINDPNPKMPTHEKLLLAGLNIQGSVKLFMRQMFPHVLVNVRPEHLHAATYAMILATATSRYIWSSEDLEVLQGVVGSRFRVPRSLGAFAGDAVSPPEFYRPEGTWDQVTNEANARIRRDTTPGELVDIPLAPVGPPIEPHTLSRPSGSISGAGNCTVCLESLSDLAQEVVELNACRHLIHLECLTALVNQVYAGIPAVRCPNCREELCASRDYKAFLE